MSARIGQIIEIVEEARDQFRGNQPNGSISQIRLNAVHSVAFRRGITTNSVSDKFIRQLKPEVSSTEQFDALLKDWLFNGSMELRDITLSHAIDMQDRQDIVSAFNIAEPQDILLSEEFGEDASSGAFLEGKERLRIHLFKERNKRLIACAKKLWLRNGELKCSVCSFSFSETYGEVGEGYIEAHHITPVSQLSESTMFRPSDLVPVCSNCHGIIHRHRPWLTIAQMKAIVVSVG
jgi:predicted HNH restriction endonuclease